MLSHQNCRRFKRIPQDDEVGPDEVHGRGTSSRRIDILGRATVGLSSHQATVSHVGRLPRACLAWFVREELHQVYTVPSALRCPVICTRAVVCGTATPPPPSPISCAGRGGVPVTDDGPRNAAARPEIAACGRASERHPGSPATPCLVPDSSLPAGHRRRLAARRCAVRSECR